MSTPLWIAVLRAGKLRRLLPVPPLPARVGSGESCQLRLQQAGVPELAGTIRPGEDGGLVFHPEGPDFPRPLTPGEHLDLAPYTLAFIAGEGAAGSEGESLARVCRLVPALLAASSEADFLRTLLDGACALLGAEWGAVLRLASTGAPSVLCSAGTRPGRQDTSISRSVLGLLAQGEAPVLAADVETTPEFQGAASLHQEVRSVIACRLGAPGSDESGALYLESRSSQRTFSQAERDLLELLCALARDALMHRRETTRLGALARVTQGEAGRAMIGAGAAMGALRQQVEQVASSQVTALLLGESGTGKEVVARAIHARSPRADQPFVPVHCMALSPELVESELFGHAKGAFSGAAADRMGRFEMADGGTLFLDELGELSPALQVKLLRALEERTVTRVGEARERRVDVHLLAATNADLEALVRQGTFREDLFYRISVFVIRIPPLRERREDLDALIGHFLDEFNRTYRKQIRGLTPEARARLEEHAWPGNVRELRNLIQQAVVREAGDQLGPESLALAPAAAVPVAPPVALADDLPREFDAARALWERAFLLRALEAEGGNVVATHRRLGMSRQNLYRKFAQFGIRPDELRS